MGQLLTEWTHLCPIGRGEDGTRFQVMEGGTACLSLHPYVDPGSPVGQEVKEMDVKGAKALSERLAEAAGNVDPTPAKAVGSGETERGPEVADTAAKG